MLPNFIQDFSAVEMQIRKFFDHLNEANTNNDEKLRSGLKELENDLLVVKTTEFMRLLDQRNADGYKIRDLKLEVEKIQK